MPILSHQPTKPELTTEPPRFKSQGGWCSFRYTHGWLKDTLPLRH